MTHTYICPDCAHAHEDPADASFVLVVLCVECETAAILAARADEHSEGARREALARTAA